MPLDFSTCIGVDTASGRKPFTYVAIDSKCQLLAVGTGDGVDVLSFVAGQTSALLALSPPARSKAAHLDQLAASLIPLNRYLDQPQLELNLLPEDGAPLSLPDGLPAWLRSSFSLAGQLPAIGYSLFPDSRSSPRQWLQTQAEACYHSFLGMPPFASGTLEGRIQRQLVLANQDLNVPDAMEFFEEITRYKLLHGILPAQNILPQSELNAWVAAYTAWLAAYDPAKVRTVSIDQDGAIYLPA